MVASLLLCCMAKSMKQSVLYAKVKHLLPASTAP